MKKSYDILVLTLVIVGMLISLPATKTISAEPLEEIDTQTSSTFVINEEIQVVELTERELIDSYIKEISGKYEVDEYLIHSIIWHESRYKPSAQNKSGTCLGLMQVCPKWHSKRAERLGVIDYMDPYSSILLGVDYIAELLVKYKNTGLVLMLYNMSHKKAFELYRNGDLSWYARSVLKRANELRQGVK